MSPSIPVFPSASMLKPSESPFDSTSKNASWFYLTISTHNLNSSPNGLSFGFLVYPVYSLWLSSCFLYTKLWKNIERSIIISLLKPFTLTINALQSIHVGYKALPCLWSAVVQFPALLLMLFLPLCQFLGHIKFILTFAFIDPVILSWIFLHLIRVFFSLLIV